MAGSYVENFAISHWLRQQEILVLRLLFISVRMNLIKKFKEREVIIDACDNN